MAYLGERCLTDEEVVQYADKQMPPPEAEAAELHMVVCTPCFTRAMNAKFDRAKTPKTR